MRNSFILFLVIILLILAQSSLYADARRLTNQANRLYADGKYVEAAEKYNEARTLDPNSDIINYDLGVAFYKKKDFGDAVKLSTIALSTENVSLEAKSNYNIGNSKYKIGVSKEASKPDESMKLFKEALGYYKRAIELDDKDDDARFNYEFVKKKLESLENSKDQQEKQENQQGKQDREKRNDKKEEPKDNSDQENKEDKKDQDQQNEENKQDQQDEKEEPKKQPEEEKEEEKKPEQEEEESPEPSGGEGEMTQEEAEMILESHKQDEESERGVEERRGFGLPQVLKDW